MAEVVRLSSIRVVPKSPSPQTLSSPSSSSINPFSVETYPPDVWLPITASRNGNAFYSAFHLLNSGIGIQALSLPVAFAYLGWFWGIMFLSVVFAWQLYTTWLLIQLHESVPGTRYSRYIHISKAAFGEKLGKLLVLFPTMYLSGGTCVMLIINAGVSMRLFFQTICEHRTEPFTAIEWYLMFVILSVIIARLLPNLNSVAGVSLIGAITAFTYCTLVWVICITKSRPVDTSHDPVKATSNVAGALNIFNALGIVAITFRGHNLVLEIQATMPSSEEHPSRVPMWRAVKWAYLLIALCLFPLAIGLYWAYGENREIQNANGGMLKALHKIHGHDHTARLVLGFACMVIVINCLSSFQIYAMPAFDNLEFAYTTKKKGPCSPWVRSGVRVFFGCVVFFIAVALPFIVNLSGVIGGIALPVTLAYPCFMWIVIKKPKRCSAMWCINWVLGSLGMVLSVLVFSGGIWSLVNPGINIRFFKP